MVTKIEPAISGLLDSVLPIKQWVPASQWVYVPNNSSVSRRLSGNDTYWTRVTYEPECYWGYLRYKFSQGAKIKSFIVIRPMQATDKVTFIS